MMKKEIYKAMQELDVLNFYNLKDDINAIGYFKSCTKKEVESDYEALKRRYSDEDLKERLVHLDNLSKNIQSNRHVNFEILERTTQEAKKIRSYILNKKLTNELKEKTTTKGRTKI